MKIIASDFDGTFTYGGVDEARRQAVMDWRNAGNKFGLVSGRSVSFLPEKFNGYGIPYDFFIGNNGAVGTDGQGKILWRKTFSGSQAAPVLKFLVENGMPECYLTTDSILSLEIPGHETGRPPVSLEEAARIPELLQVSAFMTTPEEAAVQTRKLQAEFSEILNPLLNGRVIDIVAAGVDKAAGIRKLLEFWDMEEESVIAVGDNVNDRDMIREFNAYAMENGVEEIKTLAGKVTSNVTDMIRKELAADQM